VILLGLYIYEEAELLLRRSLQLLDTLGDTHGEAQVLHSLGNVLSRKKPTEAEELLRRSLVLREELGDTFDEAQVLHSLGNLLARKGAAEAETLLRRSLVFGEKLQVTHHVAQVLHSLGKLLTRKKPKEAEELLRRSLTLREKLGDMHDIAQVLNSLADLYQKQGRPEDARTVYERVLRITDHPRDLAIAHENLATIADDVDDDLTSAAAHLAKAIAYQRRTTRRDFLATMERKLANLTRRLHG
jgi:tetratricopeptide (TPR) repeat protein